MVQKEIPLELCPNSNLQTKAIEDIKIIEELYKKGIITTINTDNDTVSNTNIIDEYQALLEKTDLIVDDLIQMNINSLSGAFISPQRKAELKAKLAEFKEKNFKDVEDRGRNENI